MAGQGPTAPDPTTLVLLRRLDALENAIRARAGWTEIEFIYDQIRSTANKMAGRRDREVDRV
jgi:hypothetical protein